MKESLAEIWCYEVEEPIPVDLSVDEQLDRLYKYAYVKEANDAFARMAGFERGEELIGLRFSDVVPRSNPENIAAMKEIIENGYNAKNILTREYYERIGERFALNNHAGVIEDGKFIRAWGTAVDITHLKKTEEKLRESEQRYRTVADFTNDWESWENPDGSLNYVSPAFERITGYGRQELIAHPELLEEIIVPEDLGDWQRHHKAAHEQQKTAEIQFRIQSKDSQIKWIEHICQPVYNDRDQYLGVRASNRDITERMNMAEQLRQQLDQITRLQDRIKAEFTYLQDEIKSDHNYENIIGNSDALKYVLYRVDEVAPTEAAVLITGETGTGKELIARAIHSASSRNERAMVKINCAALPGALIESELFGHAKGAFTGADAPRVGRFQLADGATLFLDEISEIPLELQAKLLRVLEDGEFEPLGSSKTYHADVRIIAASNRDLEEEVEKGRFRQDLLYRINVFPLSIPPLRERKEDIPLLVDWFLDRNNRRMGRTITSVPKSLIKHLQTYEWPGNIRELENVIERAVITSRGSTLKLTSEFAQFTKRHTRFKSGQTLADVEKAHILKILEKTGWKISGPKGTSTILGLAPSTLRDRMKKLGISRYKSL